MTRYEILFYNGWVEPPVYYLVGDMEGESPEEALATNLDQMVDEVREKFALDEMERSRIRESLYIVRKGGLVSAREH